MDVIVVGAGLAGLAAAGRIHAAGHGVRVFEASDGVGGRMRTDLVDGFRLDRGFHVLLTGYPDVRQQLDLEALDVRSFAPGARVWRHGGLHRLGDPVRDPAALLSTITAPIGHFSDKLRVLTLRAHSLRGELDELLARPQRTTIGGLRRAGFSHDFIHAFWRPFLGGVFFDPDLATSSRMLEFVVRMFARGDTVLPARGIGAVAHQLAGRLPGDAIHLQRGVVAVERDAVTFMDGRRATADAVVVAVDGPALAQLQGVPTRRSRSTTTIWYAADAPPIAGRYLLLDGEGRGPVNHLAVVTEVAPTYAPAGATLIAANTTRLSQAGDDDLDRAIRDQVTPWFGAKVSRWQRLRVDRIHHALPTNRVGPPMPPRRADGVYVAGDHMAHPSAQAALETGRLAATAVLRDHLRR